jgi:hypothetical protein
VKESKGRGDKMKNEKHELEMDVSLGSLFGKDAIMLDVVSMFNNEMPMDCALRVLKDRIRKDYDLIIRREYRRINSKK